MKKLFLYVYLVMMWCNIGFTERVTLGFTGDSCKIFNESKDEFGKEFEDHFQSEMIGFLNGFNMYIGMRDGESKNMKILDHNSIDYVYSNIVEFCRKNPEDQVFFGLVDYFNTLPKPKKN